MNADQYLFSKTFVLIRVHPFISAAHKGGDRSVNAGALARSRRPAPGRRTVGRETKPVVGEW
jgi:hypothetical protein